MNSAVVFNIQRFSLHDGPGIRTTVFFKGCPLRCLWCHNPESMDVRPEPLISADRCLGCELCVPVCEHGLTGRVDLDPGEHRPTAVCERCGRCAEACPGGARQMAGESLTAARLLARIRRDDPYYEESGGGVTFSGGEPLAPGAAPVVLECLAALQQAGISTAVDTCGHVASEVLRQAAAYTDLFLFDLKIMDPVRHLQATGQDNGLIQANLRWLLAEGARVWIRVPLIPGYTDDRENLTAVVDFLVRNAGPAGPPPVHLLPWHGIAGNKYLRLGQTDTLSGLPPMPEREVAIRAGWLEQGGLSVQIGG
jgi:pyruvate formate lyase activating enzyme